VLGRDFAYSLLRHVAGLAEASLHSALDRLIDADLLFVEGAPPNAVYRFKHALIRDAAYESLLKSRRQSLHRRAAEVLCETAAEPEAIAHHFTEAGLDDLAIEWWGKAGDQALRRSAFQEAIAHLRKAIEMADRAGNAASRRGAGDVGSRPEPTPEVADRLRPSDEVFQGLRRRGNQGGLRARLELAANTENFSERFAAGQGQWSLAIAQGELRSARELATTFLREAEDAGRLVEAGVAHRSLAVICYFSGDFLEGRTHCERALDACDPQHDREERERFDDDTGTSAMSCLALTSWRLGEVERARELIDTASQRATELKHVPSMASVLYWRSNLEILHGDPAGALTAAEALEVHNQEHGMTHWRILAELNAGWARGRLFDRAAGASQLRRALAAYADSGGKLAVAFHLALLADLEVETLDADSALARIDEALAQAHQVDYHCDLAVLHRFRGEILLKLDPGNFARAEEAFQNAIAVANEQRARSLSLQAALALAKLYQSTGRPAAAHTVLAPALEGFSATPELPEIAEAQALLAALAATDEVKAEAARSAQRLQLRVATSG
jgi:tetratricopeptide (TPR) repeat protein